jgi:hypothetical protein
MTRIPSENSEEKPASQYLGGGGGQEEGVEGLWVKEFTNEADR